VSSFEIQRFDCHRRASSFKSQLTSVAVSWMPAIICEQPVPPSSERALQIVKPSTRTVFAYFEDPDAQRGATCEVTLGPTSAIEGPNYDA
jgi:hypothetical protein